MEAERASVSGLTGRVSGGAGINYLRGGHRLEIVDGLTEGQIAGELKYASRRPVKHFKEQLFDKFGADNVAQLVSLAYKSGYLRPDED